MILPEVSTPAFASEAAIEVSPAWQLSLTDLPFPAASFDLATTLGCGQVFHWRREGDGWLGVIGNDAVYVEQCEDVLRVSAGYERLIAHYFSLDHPLEEICASFPTDPAMMEAARFCTGMRLVRQPVWECLATFITSSMKQVAHIAQMSHAIRAAFGQPVDWNGRQLFAYPSPERLAQATEEALRNCGLGYRAKNLLGTARMIAEGQVDLGVISQIKEDDAARAELCRLPGVGVKVANCVLLFGYERLRAFPIDVWIERILRELYFARKRNVTVEQLREFSLTYFGPFGGYAQQYLFHHGRKTWKKPKALSKSKGKAKVGKKLKPSR